MTPAYFWYYASAAPAGDQSIPTEDSAVSYASSLLLLNEFTGAVFTNQTAIAYESGSAPWIDELTESELDNLTVTQLDTLQTLGPLKLIIELYPPMGDSTVSYASTMALFQEVPPDQSLPLDPSTVTIASDLDMSVQEQAVTLDPSTVTIACDTLMMKLDLIIPFAASTVSYVSDDLAIEQMSGVLLDPTLVTIDNTIDLIVELYPPVEATTVSYQSSMNVVNQVTAELVIPTDPTDVSYTSTLDLTSDAFVSLDPADVSFESTLDLSVDATTGLDSTVSYESTLDLSVDAYLQFDPTTVTYASTAIVRDGAMFLGDYRHTCLPGTVHCYSRVGGVFGAYSRVGGTLLLNPVCTEDDPLAAQLQNTLQIGETNLVEYRCLQDKIDDSYIIDAAVTVDVVREDTTVLVSGRSMTYEATAENEGTYRAIITAAETMLLNDDEQVTVDISIVLTDGAKGFRRQIKRAVYNNASGVPVTV